MTRGLVIGKFYPPHKGHSRLIQTALNTCDSVVVLVCDAPWQIISGKLRAEWLQLLFPQAQVMVIPDIGKDDDSVAWGAYTKEFLGYTPDFVFTGSEAYGDPYAKELNATHIAIPRAFSATQVRQNPLTYLDELEVPVRSFFVPRICILGAESTGTTTLSRDLATYYQTHWVPEFGRFYSEARMHSTGDWTSREFLYIAQMQYNTENYLAGTANRILICDTNPFATTVWHERYMGSQDQTLEDFARTCHYDIHIVTDVHGVAFEQDGTRDGEHIRVSMHERFIEKLTEWQLPFIVVSGNRDTRIQTSVSAIDSIISKKSSFFT